MVRFFAIIAWLLGAMVLQATAHESTASADDLSRPVRQAEAGRTPTNVVMDGADQDTEAVEPGAIGRDRENTQCRNTDPTRLGRRHQ